MNEIIEKCLKSKLGIIVIGIVLVLIVLTGRKLNIGPDGVTLDADEKSLIITHIASTGHDFVQLQNETKESIPLGGYLIVEDNNAFTIPGGTSIAPDGSLKIYFFSKKSNDDSAISQLRQSGYLVCSSFGIKSGEKIELKDKNGNILDSMVAQ